jgi:hypothetical protein
MIFTFHQTRIIMHMEPTVGKGLSGAPFSKAMMTLPLSSGQNSRPRQSLNCEMT